MVWPNVTLHLADGLVIGEEERLLTGRILTAQKRWDHVESLKSFGAGSIRPEYRL
jgi:hypothetical protein